MIIERIGYAAMWEQLAEECAELGQAALKIARLMRGDNPTPLSMQDAMEHAKEEATDVLLCMEELEIEANEEIKEQKIMRFLDRWRQYGMK